MRCDGCAPEAADGNHTVLCATGADAVVSTPSPVGPIVTGSILGDTIPGAGPCEFWEIEGTVVMTANGRMYWECCSWKYLCLSVNRDKCSTDHTKMYHIVQAFGIGIRKRLQLGAFMSTSMDDLNSNILHCMETLSDM